MRARTVAALAAGTVISAGAWLTAQQPATAHAELKDPKGQVVGTAELTDTPHGVIVHATFTNLPAGTHAFHIHTTGRCDPPDFTSAGGHFNPTKAEHGFMSPKGYHLGDMPNIFVGKDGRGEVAKFADDVTLASGPNSLFDADGAALVVHAGADDYRTDPAGNAGARIACGVIQKK